MTTETIAVSLKEIGTKGKLALVATCGDKRVRKYVTGGYKHYVVTPRIAPGYWDSKTGTFVREPTLEVVVEKRTGSYDVAVRAKRNSGNLGSVIFTRTRYDEYVITR